MMTEPEWSRLSRRFFRRLDIQAPPYLAARVLARIEAEENRMASAWWMQWRWMSGVTAALTLAVALTTAYLSGARDTVTDQALAGLLQPQQSIQLARAEAAHVGMDEGQGADFLTEADS